MKILVSACLLGRNCKYNGGNNLCPQVVELVRDRDVLAICPEALAGLPTPRTPIEIVNGVLVDAEGNDVDALLRRTVSEITKGLDAAQIEYAVLQSRSPTCGVNQVYDGSFSGKLISGSGVFAQALREKGICVVDAGDIPRE